MYRKRGRLCLPGKTAPHLLHSIFSILCRAKRFELVEHKKTNQISICNLVRQQPELLDFFKINLLNIT